MAAGLLPRSPVISIRAKKNRTEKGGEHSMPDRLLILTVLLTGAAATDLRKGKVYDLWILPAYLAGSLWRIQNRALLQHLSIASSGMVCLPGPVPLWQSALHAFFLLPMTVILVLLPLWRWKGLGGGDVRLLAAVSLFLTPAEFLTGLFCALILGAGIGIVVLLRSGGRQHRICFAVPVFISYLCCLGGVPWNITAL